MHEICWISRKKVLGKPTHSKEGCLLVNTKVDQVERQRPIKMRLQLKRLPQEGSVTRRLQEPGTLTAQRYKLLKASKPPTVRIPLSGFSRCRNSTKYEVRDTSLKRVIALWHAGEENWGNWNIQRRRNGHVNCDICEINTTLAFPKHDKEQNHHVSF